MKIYGKVSPLDGFSHRGLKLGLILVLYDLANGKNQYGIFYGKLYNARNRTFSLENGENFIERTGQCMLLKSPVGQDCKEEFEEITSFYGLDIDCDLSENQLITYKSMFKKFKQENVVLSDIIDFMRRPGHSELLSEVDTVLKLILIIPASNAQPERIFSGLKRVKTYLRNSMLQERLNHIMLMNVHQ